MRSLRKLVAAPVVAAAALALVATQATPASAAAVGAAQVSGSGTITPALTPTGTGSYAFTFNSTTITLTGADSNGNVLLGATSTCTANGASVAETYAGGAGTGRWRCTGGYLAGRGGWLAYARVGTVVPVVLGEGTLPTAPALGLTGALACVFTPTTAAPGAINSYTLSCAGAGVILP